MGLYGMGGVGKTTISRVVCEEMGMEEEFGGKVCHVEFGGTKLVELLKMVLRDLTEASSALLDSKSYFGEVRIVDMFMVRM